MERGAREAGWYERAARGVCGAVHVPEGFRRRENASASAELRQAILFSGLGVEPYQVALFSYVVAGVMAAALIPACLAALAALGIPLIPDGLYVLVGTLILVLAFLQRPLESSIALGTVAVGVPVYFFFKRQSRRGQAAGGSIMS